VDEEKNPCSCRESKPGCPACRPNRNKVDYFMTRAQYDYAT